jgi:hypothetical protein
LIEFVLIVPHGIHAISVLSQSDRFLKTEIESYLLINLVGGILTITYSFADVKFETVNLCDIFS